MKEDGELLTRNFVYSFNIDIYILFIYLFFKIFLNIEFVFA